MALIATKSFVVIREGYPVSFDPGDEVPDWALSLGKNIPKFVSDEEDTAAESLSEDGEPVVYDYSRMTPPQLVVLCEQRGITPGSTGKKALIEALKAADEGGAPALPSPS